MFQCHTVGSGLYEDNSSGYRGREKKEFTRGMVFTMETQGLY